MFPFPRILRPDYRGPMQQPPPPVTVDRAGEDRWERVRAVRLAALAESPSAFGSTLAREREFDDDRWRSWVRDAAVYLALVHGQPVGMAAGIVVDDRALVVAMWVEPPSRGGAASAGLLRAVVGWARAAGHAELELRVMADNARAAGLYLRHGFRVAETRPVRADPARDVHRMVLALRTDDPPGP